MKTIFALSLLVVFAMVSAAADAKPKREACTSSSNGCTCTQIQQAALTPAGADCMKKLDQDAINNSSTVHNFVCTISGVYCCKVGNGQVSGCSRVSAMRLFQRGVVAPPATTLAPAQ